MAPQDAYHVYISYSIHDHRWARRLTESLRGKGFEVFFDQQQLKAGAHWDADLAEALKRSHHLVVLWSDQANRSDQVWKELTFFEALVRDPNAPTRLMIMLNLEGRNKAYGHLLAINDLQKAYREGIESLDENVWNKLVNRITAALGS